MAMTVKEIRKWLDELSGNQLIGVDEDTLGIETVARNSTYYIGRKIPAIFKESSLEIGASVSSNDRERDE